MDVRCEKCSTEYEFDEERVGANGVTVKCTACGHVFKVRRPRKIPPRASTTLGKGPQGREWLVRKPDGQMIAFRELTTLQKWIVEGRINRDDEISKNGETWKRLGNILELEPFFSVFEKARALNDLIERGGSGGRPLELRGSEVLATMNPLTAIPLGTAEATVQPPHLGAEGAQAMSSQPLPVPSAVPGAFATSIPAGAFSGAGGSGMMPAMAGLAPPPPPPPSSLSLGPPQIDAHGSSSGLLARAPGNGFGSGGTGSMRPVSSPSPSLSPPSFPAPSSPDSPVDMGFIPRSEPSASRTLPPTGSGRSLGARAAAFPKDPMSIPIDDSANESRSDIILRFERQQRFRRVWFWLVALVLLGACGGVALAKFGPPGNPLQVFAERYGLLQPKVIDDGATRPIEEAQRAFDLDTLQSLQRADLLLEQASQLRPSDPNIVADRALVMITRADALRRTGGDFGLAADEADRIREAWAAEVKAAKDAGKPPPAEPSTVDGTALRNEMTRNNEAASALLKQAFDLAASSYKAAPDAFPPARALTEYYRAQQDRPSFERESSRAKAIIEKSGATDPTLLYSEAASIFFKPTPTQDDFVKSALLLEQALSTRPSMNRARVLLARVHLARGGWDLAKAALDRVLVSAQDHQEAKWLREAATRQEQRDKPPETPAVAEKPKIEEKAKPVEPAASNAKKVEKPAEKPAPKIEKGGGEALPSTFDALMSQADHHREHDRAKKALQAYEKAADMRPSSAEPLTGMGWCYIDLDNAQAALYAFRRAIKVNDRYVEAYYGQAEALRLQGDTKAAIDAYEQYLSRAPNGPDRKAAQRALDQLKR